MKAFNRMHKIGHIANARYLPAAAASAAASSAIAFIDLYLMQEDAIFQLSAAYVALLAAVFFAVFFANFWLVLASAKIAAKFVKNWLLALVPAFAGYFFAATSIMFLWYFTTRDDPIGGVGFFEYFAMSSTPEGISTSLQFFVIAYAFMRISDGRRARRNSADTTTQQHGGGRNLRG